MFGKRFVWLIILLITCCWIFSEVGAGSDRKYVPKCRKLNMPVYASKKASHPYVVIGKVEEKSNSYFSLVCNAIEQAAALKADAVVDFNIYFDKKQKIILSGKKIKFFASGVAVRWKNAEGSVK